MIQRADSHIFRKAGPSISIAKTGAVPAEAEATLTFSCANAPGQLSNSARGRMEEEETYLVE